MVGLEVRNLTLQNELKIEIEKTIKESLLFAPLKTKENKKQKLSD